MELLIRALDDDHKLVRIEALKGLYHFKPLSAKSKIKKIAELSTDDNIKWNAIRTLSLYRDPTAAIIFAKGLKNRDWLVREEIHQSPADDQRFRDKESRPSSPYISEALNDSKESVIITTLKNLDIKDRELYAIISRIITTTPYYKQSLYLAALKAIKGYKLDRKTRNKVVELLTHRNKEVRLMALRVLKYELNQE